MIRWLHRHWRTVEGLRPSSRATRAEFHWRLRMISRSRIVLACIVSECSDFYRHMPAQKKGPPELGGLDARASTISRAWRVRNAEYLHALPDDFPTRIDCDRSWHSADELNVTIAADDAARADVTGAVRRCDDRRRALSKLTGQEAKRRAAEDAVGGLRFGLGYHAMGLGSCVSPSSSTHEGHPSGWKCIGSP